MQEQSAHWVDKLVADILAWQQKTGIAKLHVDDMKTPSGRVHVGALRGVILHDVVAKALMQAAEQPVTSTYVFNDMDNMDSLPKYLPESYSTHMGRSLHRIPAPPLEQSGISFAGTAQAEQKRYETAKNMAEFYAFDFIDAFRALGCSQEIIWSHELYESGKMDEIIRTALDSITKLRDIYQKVADYTLPAEWYPFQVICENCGLTGSTLTTDWDGKTVAYKCMQNKVEWATGCGHSGRVSPFGGTGKLLWKVDWPGHWKALGITIEGAGKDHTSAGGSRDMADAICQQVLDIPQPYDIPYEWILIRGAKMSSSKGVGTSAREFITLLPPSVARFLFVNKHYNQVIDFDPETMAIPDLFDEYDTAARIFWNQESGDTRLGRSFELSQVSDDIPDAHYLPRFRDVALYMQHPEIDVVEYFSQLKGSSFTTIEKEELAERIRYAELWVAKYAPAEYQLTPLEELPAAAQELTAEQRSFLLSLTELIASKAQWDPAELQQALFELAKTSIGSKPAFQAIYLAFLGKKAGPKAAWFVLSIPPHLWQQRIKELSAQTTQDVAQYAFTTRTDDHFFSIDSAVARRYPHITVGFAVVRGITIAPVTPELEVEKDRVVASLHGLTTDAISLFPEVQSYRKLYKETGVDWHSRRPSPEALLRRIAQGKNLYTVNTCVDAYNLAVIEHKVSVGAFDAQHIGLPSTLRFATGGEEIMLLGATEPTTISSGELCYFDQAGPYNLDFNYRDAQRTMVTPATTDIILNVDGVYDIGRKQVEETLAAAIEYITRFCGGTVAESGIYTGAKQH